MIGCRCCDVLQSQDGKYKEYSDANVWAEMWLTVIIMHRLHSVLSLVTDIVTSGCEVGTLASTAVWLLVCMRVTLAHTEGESWHAPSYARCQRNAANPVCLFCCSVHGP